LIAAAPRVEQVRPAVDRGPIASVERSTDVAWRIADGGFSGSIESDPQSAIRNGVTSSSRPRAA